MDKRQRIVALLRAEYHRASEAYRHSHAEHMGQVAAANAWDQLKPDDGIGGFRSNPYNVSIASEKENQARLYAEQMREAYDFAVDTFVSEQKHTGRLHGRPLNDDGAIEFTPEEINDKERLKAALQKHP